MLLRRALRAADTAVASQYPKHREHPDLVRLGGAAVLLVAERLWWHCKPHAREWKGEDWDCSTHLEEGRSLSDEGADRVAHATC